MRCAISSTARILILVRWLKPSKKSRVNKTVSDHIFCNNVISKPSLNFSWFFYYKKVIQLLVCTSFQKLCTILGSLVISACSTHDGNGTAIWAKFKSFLSYIVNRHGELDEPLFSKCAHWQYISPCEYLLKRIFQSI